MALVNKPDNFDKLAFEAGKQIHNHTIQLLVKGGQYGHKPHGSGVLLEVGNKRLIITAAHVTEKADSNPLFVTSKRGIIPVVGNLRETDLCKDDKADLAYIILDDKIGEILADSYQFITVNKILSHSAVRSNQYMVVGYPEVNIRADYEKHIIHAGSSIFLLTPSKDEVYDYYGFDKDKNFVLDFAGKGIDLETDTKSGKIDDPYGISGCGLWLLSEDPGAEPLALQYQLIGIMTEFRKGKYHSLIGNKIDFVISALVTLDGFKIERKTRNH